MENIAPAAVAAVFGLSPPSRIAAAFDIASAETSTALPLPVENPPKAEVGAFAFAALSSRNRDAAGFPAVSSKPPPAANPPSPPVFGVFGSAFEIFPFEGRSPLDARSTAIAAGEGTGSSDPPWNANSDSNGSPTSSTANVSSTLTVSDAATAFPASSPATKRGSSSNGPPPSIRLGSASTFPLASASVSASAAVRMLTQPRVGIGTSSRAVRLPTTTRRGSPGVERGFASASPETEPGTGGGAKGDRPGCARGAVAGVAAAGEGYVNA